MTVSVTKNLSPHVQNLADFREAEKLAAAEVERCKGELKTAKAVWEERVADLNRAVDDLIDKEREPTLFDNVEGTDGGDASGDGGGPGPSDTPPGGGGSGGGGEVMDAEVVTTIVATGLAPSDPAPLSLPAAAVATGEGSAEPPTWHRMTLDDAFEAEVDIPVKVLDTLKAAGVETCGVLAAKLVEGESFGLEKPDIEHLCRGIEQMSEDDDKPIVLTSEPLSESDADDEAVLRGPSSAARWERLFSLNPAAYSTPSDLRRRQLIADFRDREAAAASVGEQPAPKWGLWSEFEVKLASGDAVFVCYEPGEVTGKDEIGHFADHFEFTGAATSSTGYRSHYQNFDAKHPRPGDVSLTEWARQFAESLYVEQQAESKKRAPHVAGKGGKGGKAGKSEKAKGNGPKGKGGKKVAA